MSPLPSALNRAPALNACVPDWPRAVRLHDRWTVTERIDGTRSAVLVEPADDERPLPPGPPAVSGVDGCVVLVRAASRTRWLVPEPEARATGEGRDNFRFAAWVAAHATQLAALGPGIHRGVWYGAGIGHGYGLAERRLALLDTARWHVAGLPAVLPGAVALVPILAECAGHELNATIAACLDHLAEHGSALVAGAAAAGVLARSAADPRFIIEATAEPVQQAV